MHLGRQAITVFLKDKIHAAFGELRFFIIAATNLLLLTVGCANTHLLLSAIID